MLHSIRRIAEAAVDLARLGPLRRFSDARRVVVLDTGPGTGLRFCQAPSKENHGGGANELPVQDAMASVLRPGDVFYDIGANVGYLTIVGAKLVGPRGKVYAFEPVPTNIAALRRNLSLNNFATVSIVQQAVSSTAGRQQLILAADPGGAALSVADRPPDAAGAMDVEVTTLDLFLQQVGGRPPGLVKIDVEGAEINVLQGMAMTIERCRPAVLVEIDGPTNAHVQVKAKVCADFLKARGYQIQRLADSYPGNRWRVLHFLARWSGCEDDDGGSGA